MLRRGGRGGGEPERGSGPDDDQNVTAGDNLVMITRNAADQGSLTAKELRGSNGDEGSRSGEATDCHDPREDSRGEEGRASRQDGEPGTGMATLFSRPSKRIGQLWKEDQVKSPISRLGTLATMKYCLLVSFMCALQLVGVITCLRMDEVQGPIS
jgi:hypothetical protein